MITKERLEELIKEEATVYYNYDECVQEKTLNKTYEADSAYLWGKIKGGAVRSCGYPLEDLFETKEDAEFALRYQNITRTETLSLPTWEEINNCIETKCFGNHTIANFDSFVFEYKRTKTKTVLGVNRGSETIFYDNLTKANYLEACEICRKLFLEKEG